MAKQRQILETTMDRHADVAKNLSRQQDKAARERLDNKYPLNKLKPSASNPRRLRLDRAGVNMTQIQNLAIRPGETQESWMIRFEAFLDSLDGRLSPDLITVWEEIYELAISILTSEMTQPIVANEAGDIISGERRWTASLLAGLHSNRVILRDMDETAALIAQFVENLMRSDLTFTETIGSLRKVFIRVTGEECGPGNEHITLQECQKYLGKGKSQAALYRSLCRLPEGDPVLKRLYADGYASLQDAYADAQHRHKELRMSGAKGPDLDDEVQHNSLKPGGSATPKIKPSAGIKTPQIKARLPGTLGGKRFLAAIEGIDDLTPNVVTRIQAVAEQWEAAPEKSRRKMMTELLNNLFSEMDSLDAQDDAELEGAAE